MNFKIIKYLLLSGLISCAYGQNSDFSVKLQYGRINYNDLGSMKDFQQMIEATYAQLGLPVKSVQSFPDAPELTYIYVRDFPEISVGIFYNSSASGGRFHYADYSGSITFDYILNNQRYGFILSPPEFKLGFLRFSQTLQLGRMLSRFEFHEDVKVWDQTQTDRTSVETVVYFIEPGIDLKLINWHKWSLGTYLGANIPLFAKPYHLRRNEKAMLSFENGHKLKADWKEIKLGVTLTYAGN